MNKQDRREGQEGRDRQDRREGKTLRSPLPAHPARPALPALLMFAVAVIAATDSRPPIVDAAKRGDRAALQALVGKHADVNTTEPDGSTALHWASYRDD